MMPKVRKVEEEIEKRNNRLKSNITRAGRNGRKKELKRFSVSHGAAKTNRAKQAEGSMPPLHTCPILFTFVCFHFNAGQLDFHSLLHITRQYYHPYTLHPGRLIYQPIKRFQGTLVNET